MFQKKTQQPIAATCKTPDEIEKMRIAGRLAADVLQMIAPHVREGVTTDDLDRLCHNYIVHTQKAIPAPLNYRGFPKSICTSLNHVVCHGIPGDRRLKKGDVLNVDVTVLKEGFHGDSSQMFYIDPVPVIAQRVSRISYECLCLALKQVRPGARLGDLGHAIQKHAESQHCSVVREYCGHGIGRGFHEQPQVLHFGNAGAGLELLPGMTFTIEPMINAGQRHVKTLPDGWTVVTKDRSISAQWEHTVLVTPTGYEVLTLRSNEVI